MGETVSIRTILRPSPCDNRQAPPLAERLERIMPDLPSATVTFLFTDIEGSTERWERNPSAMRAASSGKICDNGGQRLRSPREGVGLLREADGSKVTRSHAMEPSTILEASRPAEASPV